MTKSTKKSAARPGKATARAAEPPKALRDALIGLPMPQVIRTDDPPYRVLGEGFLPLWGGDEWLFDFDAKKAPGFDRARWFVVGTNGQSDLWFYDLDSGKIVIFDHELGYDDAHCEPFSDDWQTFVRAIEPTRIPKKAAAKKTAAKPKKTAAKPKKTAAKPKKTAAKKTAAKPKKTAAKKAAPKPKAKPKAKKKAAAKKR